MLCAVLAITACSTSQLPAPRSEGAALYRARCGGCHALAHPRRHTAEGWAQMMDLMEQRMRERGMPALSDDERRIIMGYLTDHAR